MAVQQEKRHSLQIDIFYGLSTLGTSALGFIVASWLLYFYIPPDGDPLVPVALFGTAVFVGRAVSAVIIPYIGYLTDNTHSRWGRRLPYMFVAALPVVVVFIFIWKPPQQSETILNLLYLGIMAVIYWIAAALYQVPYQALLPEIATTDRHRIRISAWRSGFLLIGMMLGGLAGLLIEKIDFFFTMVIYAAVALPLLYLPFLVLRESPDRRVRVAQRMGFWESLSIAFKNRAFLVFAAVWALYLMTTTLVQSSVPFIVTEVCLLDESDTTLIYIPGVLASLAWYPVVTWLANRWGKWRVFAGSILASALIFPGTMLMGGWYLISLKTQCVSWAILQAIAISGVVVLSSTFVAEITDRDQGLTGQRREGVYFAVMKVLDQFFSGVAVLILPIILLLGRSHLSPQGALGVRMTGVIAGVLMLLGFLLFTRYPNQPS